jgi:hypothetical protein
MVRLGLPWRLNGMPGVDVGPLGLLVVVVLLLACLKRVGSDSLLVNGGRGILAGYVATSLRRYVDCTHAGRPCWLAAVAKYCLILGAAAAQSCPVLSCLFHCMHVCRLPGRLARCSGGAEGVQL